MAGRVVCCLFSHQYAIIMWLRYDDGRSWRYEPMTLTWRTDVNGAGDYAGGRNYHWALLKVQEVPGLYPVIGS
jgi:hypothetical protein